MSSSLQKNVVFGAAPAACSNFESMQIHPEYQIYDVNMFETQNLADKIRHYFDCCMDSCAAPVMVSTSCFSTWRKAKKTNGAGKIIPAIAESSLGGKQAPRVFFFDDNINLHLGGTSNTEGICNLRDTCTGEFVDFSTGSNGFIQESLFEYTTVQSSTEYRNVLVQANILDAMTNVDYFKSIILRYSKPGERVLVIADVNGTIMSDDTARGKSHTEMLLSLMFTFTEVWPRGVDDPVEFSWRLKPSVCIERRQDLRNLVKSIAAKDDNFYSDFWSSANCELFLDALTSFANVGCSKEDRTIDTPQFFEQYRKNLDLIQDSVSRDGIPSSWFRCHEWLVSEGHAVVLNSFGVDTHRVVKCLVPDVRQVLQLTFNYKCWSERDVAMWGKQFEPSEKEDDPK